jgi:phosphoribosylpyrophosphate synthetase
MSDWEIVLCSGVEHLRERLEPKFAVHISSMNYDGKRAFPNSDIYSRLAKIEKLSNKNVCLIQSCTYSSELESEKFTTGDRLIETLQFIEILNNPVKIELNHSDQKTEHKLQHARTLITMYTFLPFSKQDGVYQTGEVASAELAVRLTLQSGAKRVVAIDPHPPQQFEWVAKLVRSKSFDAISIVPKMIQEAKRKFELDDPMVIVPPGKMRYETLAQISHMAKERVDSYSVIVTGATQVKGRDVIVVDDMALSGITLSKTYEKIKDLGAKNVCCCVPHLLPLVKEGEERIRQLIRNTDKHIIASNTVRSRIFEEEYPDLLVDCSTLIVEYLNEYQQA